jgi:hypothetical protein
VLYTLFVATYSKRVASVAVASAAVLLFSDNRDNRSRLELRVGGTRGGDVVVVGGAVGRVILGREKAEPKTSLLPDWLLARFSSLTIMHKRRRRRKH